METKIIETPIEKHKVEIKKTLTARDFREIQLAGASDEIKYRFNQAEFEAMKRSGEIEITLLDAFKMSNAEEDAKINTLVVSVDGVKENLNEVVLNFCKSDFDFVMAEINKIIEGDKKKQRIVENTTNQES
jgi:hypothetical protein